MIDKIENTVLGAIDEPHSTVCCWSASFVDARGFVTNRRSRFSDIAADKEETYKIESNEGENKEQMMQGGVNTGLR
jgi:hypothetical protein